MNFFWTLGKKTPISFWLRGPSTMCSLLRATETCQSGPCDFYSDGMATVFAVSPFKRYSLFPHLLNLGWPCGSRVVPVLRLGLKKPCSFQSYILGTLKPCEQARACWIMRNT